MRQASVTVVNKTKRIPGFEFSETEATKKAKKEEDVIEEMRTIIR